MRIRNFQIHEGEALEKIFSSACFITGAVFLVIALLGAWCHLFTMSVCVAASLLIKEDTPHQSK